MQNELMTIVKESGLEESKAQTLLDNFGNYFQIADEWKKKADALVITDVSQKAEMQMARAGRLFLKEKRVSVEKTRKLLGENALREKQTIDSVAKILVNLIEPIENDLERKEKYAEIQEANRLKALREFRTEEINPYIEFAIQGIDLGTMTEESYHKYLSSLKIQMAEKEKAIAEENERIRHMNLIRELRERRELELRPYWNFVSGKYPDFGMMNNDEYYKVIKVAKQAKSNHEKQQERIRQENEKLRLEAEKKAKELVAQKAKADKEKAEMEARMKAEREAAEKILAEEKQKTIRLETERKAAELAELKRKADEEAERKKREKAPDKIKLKVWVTAFAEPKIGELKSPESKAIHSVISSKFNSFKHWADQEINNI